MTPTLQEAVLQPDAAPAGRLSAASHVDYLVAADAAHAHELYLSLYISSGLRDHVPRVRAVEPG